MPDIAIRFATADDAGLLLRLIRELAAFEKSPDAVVATEADLIRHGFGPNRQFEAILAFVDSQPAGCALFHTRFSTWLGRPGLYLEDLYVTEQARGRGVGRRLMTRLAAFVLLGMTAVIEIFVYPLAWPTHIQWAAMLLVLLCRGAGALSIDHLLWRRFDR